MCVYHYPCVSFVSADYYVRSLLTAGLANAMQISKFVIKRTIFIFKMAAGERGAVRGVINRGRGGLEIPSKRGLIKGGGGLCLVGLSSGREACT